MAHRQAQWEQTCNRSREFMSMLGSLQTQHDWDKRFPATGFPDVFSKIRRRLQQGEVIESLSDFLSAPEKASSLQHWMGHLMLVHHVLVALRNAPRGALPPLDFVLGGSLAKDTAVDPNSTDIDLVVMFPDFTPDKHEEYLQFIENAVRNSKDLEESQLSRRAFYFFTGQRDSNAVPTTQFSEVAKHAKYVHLVKLVSSRKVEVDVLIGKRVTKRDLSQIFPERDSHTAQAHDEVPGLRALWSASCTPLCVEFVAKMPNHVLVAIRALKQWVKSLKIEKRGCRPSSFLIELLAVAKYQPESLQHCATSRDLVVSVLDEMRKPSKRITHIWREYYSEEDVAPAILKKRPLVLAPVKKWNNVARKHNFAVVRRVAKSALQILDSTKASSQERFRDVSIWIPEQWVPEEWEKDSQPPAERFKCEFGGLMATEVVSVGQHGELWPAEDESSRRVALCMRLQYARIQETTGISKEEVKSLHDAFLGSLRERGIQIR